MLLARLLLTLATVASVTSTHRQVLSLASISFSPGPALAVAQGTTVVTTVNITVPAPALAAGLRGAQIHVCCRADPVAITHYSRDTYITDLTTLTTLITLPVLGGRLGRSKLSFYVYTNSSQPPTPPAQPAVQAVRGKEEAGFINPPSSPDGLVTSHHTTTTTTAPILTITTHPSNSPPTVPRPPATDLVVDMNPPFRAGQAASPQDGQQPITQSDAASSTSKEKKKLRRRKKKKKKKEKNQNWTQAPGQDGQDEESEEEYVYEYEENPLFEEFDDSTPPPGWKNKYRWVRQVNMPHERVARDTKGRLLTKTEYEQQQREKKRQQEAGQDDQEDDYDYYEDVVTEEPDPNIWWLPHDYNVIVYVEHNPIVEYIQYLLLAVTGASLLGVGGQLDVDEVLYLLKRPVAILVAALARFLVMPALSVGLTELLAPQHDAACGMLALAGAASEGAALLLLLLLEADLTLAATITVTNNVIALGALPLWGLLFHHHLYGLPAPLAAPYQHLALLILSQVALLMGGFLIQRRWPKVYSQVWPHLPVLTAFTLLFFIAMEIWRNYYVFELLTAAIFVMAAMMAAAGFLFGAASAFIFRLPFSRLVVIAVETGVRTSFLAGVTVGASLAVPEGDTAKTGPAAWCLLSLFPTYLTAICVRFYRRYMGRRYAATECTIIDVEDNKSLEEGPEVLDSKETAI